MLPDLQFTKPLGCSRAFAPAHLRQRIQRHQKLAALIAAICCIFVLSGCSGIRHSGPSLFARSAKSSSHQPAEQADIALVSHQELIHPQSDPPASNPARSMQFSDEAELVLPPEFSSEPSMDTQPIAPPMNSHAPAPPISNQPQAPVANAFPQGPYGPPPKTNVVRTQGDRFRQPQQTATELLVVMRADNEKLMVELRSQKLAYSNLLKELKAEQTAHQQTLAELGRSKAEADQLRKLSATLQVKADRLAREKIDIKQQSDAALKKIEASLDAVLLDSIARARKTANP